MNKEVVNTRTGVGAGIGAVMGFLFAGPMGAGIGALVGGGVAHSTGNTQKGVLTPRRKLIFSRAMESIKDPVELEKLATAFHGEGLVTEAAALKKRAALRKLPTNAKEKRRAAFRKAMASDDPEIISAVAEAFKSEGALDAAKALKDHADAVRAAHAAGKSSKPLTGGSQAQFADKLAKAIIHFGPESKQAFAAAGNLVQARGKQASEVLIREVIRVAADALRIEAPAPQETAVTIEESPSEPAPEEGTGEVIETQGETVQEEEPAQTGATAPEPASVGAAPEAIETEVVAGGVALESGVPTADHAENVASTPVAESTEA